MVTKIKPGDIVECRGKRVRVMSVDPTLPFLKCRLSHFGWLTIKSSDNLKLLESSLDTILKAGDKVIIHDIPDEEKYDYGVTWVRNMSTFTKPYESHIITSVCYSDYNGWVGQIHGYNFQLYHVEPVHNFDMI